MFSSFQIQKWHIACSYKFVVKSISDMFTGKNQSLSLELHNKSCPAPDSFTMQTD